MLPGERSQCKRALVFRPPPTKIATTPLPPSPRVDRLQLAKRSADTQWELGTVRSWLLDWPSNNSRALVILAGAGTGKSTISDELCESLLMLPRSDGAGGGRASSKLMASSEPSLLSAAHFLKHSDLRRLDSVAIVRSVAYQLACR